MDYSQTLAIPAANSTGGRTSRLAFARHYGEMLLVMFAGMVVFGGLSELGFAMANSNVHDQSAALQVTLMGAYMTIPMAAWMAYRGHTLAQNIEMAGSMIVPTAFAAALALAGVAGEHAAMAIQHGIMFPAMFAVMLLRYDEYAHVHHG